MDFNFPNILSLALRGWPSNPHVPKCNFAAGVMEPHTHENTGLNPFKCCEIYPVAISNTANA